MAHLASTSQGFTNLQNLVAQYIPGATVTQPATGRYEDISIRFPNGQTINTGDRPSMIQLLNQFGAAPLAAQLYGEGDDPTARQDYNTMSDADLMGLASGLGIDTAQFNVQPSQLDTALRDVNALNVERGPVELGADVRGEVANVYEPQRQQFLEELRRNTVELAGQRGLGYGDADIPQRVAERLSTGLAGLRGQEAQSLLSLSEQARQNRLQQLGLREQGLLGRGNLAENQRQFENNFGFNQQQANRSFLMNAAQFQNNLRQQAFQNRLQLSGQTGQMGLGLAGARQGISTGSTGFNPMTQFEIAGRGLNTLSGGIQSIGNFLGF